MLENTESQEMYLTTIYALQKKNGMVRSVDVADERGYSKVSVHTFARTAERLPRRIWASNMNRYHRISDICSVNISLICGGCY